MDGPQQLDHLRSAHTALIAILGLPIAAWGLWGLRSWWRQTRPVGAVLPRRRSWLTKVLIFVLFELFLLVDVASGHGILTTPWSNIIEFAIGIPCLLLMCVVPFVNRFAVFDFLVAPALRGTDKAESHRAGPSSGNRHHKAPSGSGAGRPASRKGGAYLRVCREKTLWRDRLRVYQIEIDGKAVGSIGNGKEFVSEVTAGKHTVRARISSTGSPAMEVFVAAGSIVSIRVEPALGDPFDGIRTPDGYLRLMLEE